MHENRAVDIETRGQILELGQLGVDDGAEIGVVGVGQAQLEAAELGGAEAADRATRALHLELLELGQGLDHGLELGT